MVNLSYLVFQSLTRFLEASCLARQRQGGSLCPALLTSVPQPVLSPNIRNLERIDPALQHLLVTVPKGSPYNMCQPLLSHVGTRTYVFLRCSWVNAPFARLYEFSLFFITVSIDVISYKRVRILRGITLRRYQRTP